MILAEIHITTAAGFGLAAAVHTIPFSDLELAKAEYKRIADLLTAKGGRGNGGGMLECMGDCGSKVTTQLSDVSSVGLVDFATLNKQREGTRDNFPRLFDRS